MKTHKKTKQLRFGLLLLLVSASLCLVAALPVRAEPILSLTNWDLTTSLHRGTSHLFEILSTPQNPFTYTSIRSLPPNTFASTSYDISGDLRLRMDISHRAERAASLTTTSSTGLYDVLVSRNSSLTARCDWTYELPPAIMLVTMQCRAFDLTAGQSLFNILREDLSDIGDPQSGTFTTGTQEHLLLAGHTYRFRYEFSIDAFSGATGPAGIGNGFFDYQITPINIPEPASLLPLALSALLLLRLPGTRSLQFMRLPPVSGRTR